MPSIWKEKRGKTWRVIWRIGDNRQSQNCGPYRHVAEQFEANKKHELFSNYAGLPDSLDISVADFAREYLEDCAKHKAANTVTHFDSPAISHFANFAEGKALGAITHKDIMGWENALMRDYSANTVRMKMRCLRTAFSFAVRLKYVTINPLSGLHMPLEEEVARVLTDEEISILLRDIRPDAAGPCMLSLYAFLRRGEVLSAEWGNLRKTGKSWELTIQRSLDNKFQTKNRKSRVIPLPDAVIQFLPPIQKAGKIFGGISPSMLNKQLEHVAKKNKLGRIRFHDLRHTGATRFLEAGGNIFELMSRGGWSSLASMKKYIHIQARKPSEVAIHVNYHLDCPQHAPT